MSSSPTTRAPWMFWVGALVLHFDTVDVAAVYSAEMNSGLHFCFLYVVIYSNSIDLVI